ncbi:RagB/SusD family nutrient uptake outer membrane protein [Pedobacter sp.]|uniref:RagB/SusD family nutrient uptake outer membrane protein n=1 Tax=Pedobacter sp. TaxID=1411316 RepID=UPI003D7F5E12
MLPFTSIYAETLIKNGKSGLAKTSVDQIRKRGGQPALAAAPTMDDIKRERRLEFIGEGRRYFYFEPTMYLAKSS